MVNLNKFKIRITGPIPFRFRQMVEDAISETFLQQLIYSTDYFKGVVSRNLWKVEYQPWYGFIIYAQNTKGREYAHIVSWLNYGTKAHMIPNKVDFERMKKGRIPKRFLVFPDTGIIKRNKKTIEGNESFVVGGNVYALAVNHPGIIAKHFIEDVILENNELDNKFYDIIEKNERFKKMNLMNQLSLFSKTTDSHRIILGL